MSLVDATNPYRDPDYRDAWEQGFEDGKLGEPMSTTVGPLWKALRRGYAAGQHARRPDLLTWAASVGELATIARDVADNDPGIAALNAARLREAVDEVEKMC